MHTPSSKCHQAVFPQLHFTSCRFKLALSDVVKPHTPACYMSGFDLKDAFLLWPRSQHSCDLLGIKGPPLRADY